MNGRISTWNIASVFLARRLRSVRVSEIVSDVKTMPYMEVTFIQCKQMAVNLVLQKGRYF